MKNKIMTMITLILLLAVAAVLLAAGCSGFGLSGHAAPVEELDQRLVNANNKFGFDLFKLLSAEGEENLFISPASIITALAMTYNGAEDETKAAMEEVLNLKGMSIEEANEAFRDLLTVLENPDPKVKLTVANSLWGREGYIFNEDFLKRNKDYYRAEVNYLDFSDAKAADTINSWVLKKTGGHIEEIVTPPIDPATVLFLINAIYFKGEWAAPFDEENTRDHKFTAAGGSASDVPTMFASDRFDYQENDLFQAVKLPYGKNERVSMHLFLPNEDKSLAEFYDELNQANWDKWVASFASMEGELGLPKFKYEYEASLKDALQLLGMGVAFDAGRADFGGMHPEPPVLFISEVKHKAFVEVNEEGTEAAAVTSVEIKLTAALETFNMVIDRPFFFAIADDFTGTILFMGEVLNL